MQKRMDKLRSELAIVRKMGETIESQTIVIGVPNVSISAVSNAIESALGYIEQIVSDVPELDVAMGHIEEALKSLSRFEGPKSELKGTETHLREVKIPYCYAKSNSTTGKPPPAPHFPPRSPAT